MTVTPISEEFQAKQERELAAVQLIDIIEKLGNGANTGVNYYKKAADDSVKGVLIVRFTDSDSTYGANAFCKFPAEVDSALTYLEQNPAAGSKVTLKLLQKAMVAVESASQYLYENKQIKTTGDAPIPRRA